MNASLLAELRKAADAEAPREACGLLFARGTRGAVVRMTTLPNVAPHPERAFELDPGAFVAAEAEARSRGETVVGVWHAHPSGPAAPSRLDREGAWSGWVQVIVGRSTVRAWRPRATHAWEELTISGTCSPARAPGPARSRACR